MPTKERLSVRGLAWWVPVLILIRLLSILLFPMQAKSDLRLVYDWLRSRLPRRLVLFSRRLYDFLARLVEGTSATALPSNTVSIAYYRYIARRDVRSCIWLTATTCVQAGIVLLTRPPNMHSLLALVAVQAMLCVSLLIRVRALRYRVESGLFGTTAQEAREVIGFLVQQVDDIDFTGNSGKRLPALVREEIERLQPGIRQSKEARA